MKVEVAFLPKCIEEQDLSNTVCVILDIFRATTSIVTAMSHGCRMIYPVDSLDKAYEAAKQLGNVLMAGNSPWEFTAEKVWEQQIVMTTTNGTVAIQAAKEAFCTLIGSFHNAEAVCQQIKQFNKDVFIICAGTDRAFSLEDSLCAGFLVDKLANSNTVKLNDSALGARVMYQAAQDRLIETAIKSRNGRRLVELGKEAEVGLCLRRDIVNVVPVFKNNRIFLP